MRQNGPHHNFGLLSHYSTLWFTIQTYRSFRGGGVIHRFRMTPRVFQFMIGPPWMTCIRRGLTSLAMPCLTCPFFYNIFQKLKSSRVYASVMRLTQNVSHMSSLTDSLTDRDVIHVCVHWCIHGLCHVAFGKEVYPTAPFSIWERSLSQTLPMPLQLIWTPRIGKALQ